MDAKRRVWSLGQLADLRSAAKRGGGVQWWWYLACCKSVGLLTLYFVAYTIKTMAKAHVPSEAAEVIARECLATRMRRLNRVVSGIYDRAFREIGLTGSQVSILVVLDQAGGARPVEVCQALQMDKSTLCRNIQRMQRRGWVRTAATGDGRSHRLEISGVGRGLIEKALPLWRGAQAQARELLGEAVVDPLFKAVDASFTGDELRDRGVAGRESGVLASSERILRDSGRPSKKVIFFWE